MGFRLLFSTADNTYLICASLLASLLILYFLYIRGRKKRLTEASVEFRARVLQELNGLYPIPRYLRPEVMEKFSGSVPGIESAAAEFRKYISPKKRPEFDAALETYSDHCKKITWESCVAFRVTPGEKRPEEEGPKEVFRQNVNTLLSFAK